MGREPCTELAERSALLLSSAHQARRFMARYRTAGEKPHGAKLGAEQALWRAICRPESAEGTLTSVKAHGRIGRKKAQESQRRDLVNLRRTRDLLLPKLISGELAVGT